MPITKIVSGGQTGVDQAGLEAAIYCKIPHGGWCPKGRKSEDGRIPAHSFRIVHLFKISTICLAQIRVGCKIFPKRGFVQYTGEPDYVLS
jgi:hypothetical protein